MFIMFSVTTHSLVCFRTWARQLGAVLELEANPAVLHGTVCCLAINAKHWVMVGGGGGDGPGW